jgi:hypothetical protein
MMSHFYFVLFLELLYFICDHMNFDCSVFKTNKYTLVPNKSKCKRIDGFSSNNKIHT